mmetsp:Transcript_27028/g.63451  ORF Transcript_27028/g.63451 Transcript_27028/m.63451 type:complete len:723 (+) Transcript_27028:89-2257(+)
MAAFAVLISVLPAALAQQQAGGDYQRYLDQYAGDYEKYIGSGGSAGGSGFTKYYQKYMQQYGDYTKYMNGGHSGDGYESFLGQYAGKFMSGDKAASKADAEARKPATPVALASSDRGGSGQKPSYMDFQRYLQGQGAASRPSDFSHYMNQYAADYQKKHAQGAQAGDFSKFMDQYASDYQHYMQSQAPGGSPGSQGGGDSQQFMDFTKYMHGGQAPQGGASFSKYMDGYADFQKYMQGHGSSGDFSKYYQQYMQQRASQGGGYQKYSDQGGDFSKFMAEYAGDYSKYAGQGSKAQGSQGGFSNYMKDYADYQKYMQGQGGSRGDYMSQYASDYQKYMQGQGGQGQGQGSQDYSKFMDQYAHAYMGQSSVGTGDFKKYMDYQQYMRGQSSHTPDSSRYTSKFASDYDRYMPASDREGHSGHLGRRDHGSQKSASDSANDTSPVVFAGTQPDLNSFMGNHADYQQYLTTHGQGAPQGFQAFMGNYTDSFHKYMHARGSQAAGDFGKYFSDYQNYEQNKGKQEAAGFQHYMKGYADDYSKYVQERGDSAADAKSKSGNFQKYIAQYAGNYQKYMQDQPSASAPSAPTLFATPDASAAEPVPKQTQEQREHEKLQKEQQALHAELQAEKERLSSELKKEREQRQEEKEHLQAELQAEQKQRSQAAQPAALAETARSFGSKLMSASPLLAGLLMVAGVCGLLRRRTLRRRAADDDYLMQLDPPLAAV